MSSKRGRWPTRPDDLGLLGKTEEGQHGIHETKRNERAPLTGQCWKPREGEPRKSRSGKLKELIAENGPSE